MRNIRICSFNHQFSTLKINPCKNVHQFFSILFHFLGLFNFVTNQIDSHFIQQIANIGQRQS